MGEWKYSSTIPLDGVEGSASQHPFDTSLVGIRADLDAVERKVAYPYQKSNSDRPHCAILISKINVQR
jgi:hypothetical protein